VIIPARSQRTHDSAYVRLASLGLGHFDHSFGQVRGLTLVLIVRRAESERSVITRPPAPAKASEVICPALKVGWRLRFAG